MPRVALMLVTLCACGDNLDAEIRGPHRTYVMSRQLIPTSNTAARENGLDLGGPGGGGPDGVIDNQMGMVLATLSSMGTEVQPATDRLVDRGELLQLIDVQIPDVREGAAAGFSVQFGTNPTPPPCNGAEDTVCRGHLQGNGIFEIDPSSSWSQLRSLGDETSYVGGPGPLSIQVGFFGAPVRLDLVGAQVRFVESQGALTGVIGGGVTRRDLQERLFPPLVVLATSIVQRDCKMLDNPTGGCGCVRDSSGKTLLGLFDTRPKDCEITLDEIVNNSLVVSLVAADLSIDGMLLLSFGFRFEAVPAELAM